MPSASYDQYGTYLVSTSGIASVTISFSGSAVTNYIFIAYAQTNNNSGPMYGYFNGNSGSGNWTRLYTYASSGSTPPSGVTSSGSNYWNAAYPNNLPNAATNANTFGTYRLIGSNIGQSEMTLLADGITFNDTTVIPIYTWTRNTWATTGAKSSITFLCGGDTFAIGSRFSIYGMA
jgi:hypothetical protein